MICVIHDSDFLMSPNKNNPIRITKGLQRHRYLSSGMTRASFIPTICIRISLCEYGFPYLDSQRNQTNKYIHMGQELTYKQYENSSPARQCNIYIYICNIYFIELLKRSVLFIIQSFLLLVKVIIYI